MLAFALDGTIPAFVLDAPGLLHDNTVIDFVGLYTLLTVVYECNGGKLSWTMLLQEQIMISLKCQDKRYALYLENVP